MLSLLGYVSVVAFIALLQSRLSLLPILTLVLESFLVSTSVNKLFRNVVWLSMIFAFLLASQSL